MGRAPCCDKSKVRSGPWSPAEDFRLISFIQKHGHSNWRALPKQAGLLRCGKSCRLRWINYLRPDVKRGNFTPEEEQTIIDLHTSIGNKWSKIASYLPGRTDNEIKNVWNTHLKKRLPAEKGKSAVDNCHNTTEAKDSSQMDCSASSSSAPSSSITTSGDENTERSRILDQAVQDSEVMQKLPNETPELLEILSLNASHDDHSASSSSSSSSHDSCPAHNRPKEALTCSKSDEDTTVTQLEGDLDNNGEPENPTDNPDLDFWQVLDSLADDPLQYTTTQHNVGRQDSVFESDQTDFSKWLRFLESELGLTSDGDCLPKDQDLVTTATHEQYTQTYSFQPEISPHELDYSPMWPCSASPLGI